MVANGLSRSCSQRLFAHITPTRVVKRRLRVACTPREGKGKISWHEAFEARKCAGKEHL